MVAQSLSDLSDQLARSQVHALQEANQSLSHEPRVGGFVHELGDCGQDLQRIAGMVAADASALRLYVDWVESLDNTLTLTKMTAVATMKVGRRTFRTPGWIRNLKATEKPALSYPGDGASTQQRAEWLSVAARRAGLPPELPVMAALVESGLANLPEGDADSVGLFQMRIGIWNQGAYAGYPERPELQVKWFVDQALAVKKARIDAGDTQFGTDPLTWGAWIADIEVPAEQYRGRYQLRLEEARALLGR
jgi:hypothetical protein